MKTGSKLSTIVAPLALTLIVCLIGTRHGDQVAVILDDLRLANFILLTIVLVAAGLCLRILMRAGPEDMRGIDAALACAPVAALTLCWLYRGNWLAALVSAAGILLQIVVMRRLLREAVPPKMQLLVLGAAVALWLAVFIAMTVSPVAFPRSLGSAGLTILFFSLVAIGLQASIRFPLVLLPLLALFAGAFFLHEQEHKIELIEYEPAGSEGEPAQDIRTQVKLKDAFATWLLSRNDLADYRRRNVPYPVFVATSQGGGGYAAAHANLFLSKLQARCPNFAQHLFAAVGVSGGAVGNVMFAGNLTGDTNPEGSHDCTPLPPSDALLQQASTDHLSPVLAALYFRDFPNKILFGLLGGPDRSAALRSSIAERLGSGAAGDPLAWDQFWRKNKDQDGWSLGEQPALVAVATNATSGRRFVFAPFAFSAADDRFEEALSALNATNEHDIYSSSDLHVLDAAIASASFPYVTPSRMLKGYALVDGGYIENDGAETVRDILAELQSQTLRFDPSAIPRLRFPASYRAANGVQDCRDAVLVYVPAITDRTTAPLAPGDAQIDPCRVPFSVHVISIRSEVPEGVEITRQNFFLDPLTSLLSARARRGEIARFALISQLCGEYNCDPDDAMASRWHFYESVVRTDQLLLPLGWYLPIEKIRALSNCVAPDPNEAFEVDDGPPEGGMAAIIRWQSNRFSTMKSNPDTMGMIMTVLDPEGRNPLDASKTVPGPCSAAALSKTG